MATVGMGNAEHPLETGVAVTKGVSPPTRLEFLDGLRGMAAIYVVLFHAGYFARELNLSAPGQFLRAVLDYGHNAVDVFIVLSGYCLMLPVVRSAEKRFPRGIMDYFRRRAYRILPPYYVALVLSLMLVLAGQFLSHTGKVEGKAIPTVLTPGIVLSHLFLVHDLSLAWVFRINAPMWSVATEWQIYFIFPLLLPIWRRFGEMTTVVAACLVGLLPIVILPAERNFWWASPWFIGLFAMGMAAASADFSGKTSLIRWRKVLTSPAAMVAFLIGFIMLTISPDRHLVNIWSGDLLLGLVTSGLIMACKHSAMDSQQQRKSFFLRLFEQPVFIKLGAFSYSLYLIHHPLQQVMLRLFQARFHDPNTVMYLQIFVGSPFILAAAYLFHLLFERPFLAARRRQTS